MVNKDNYLEEYCNKISMDICDSNQIPYTPWFRSDDSVPAMELLNNGIVFNPKFVLKFSQSEMAFIIGHEIAHVLYNHTAKEKSLGRITCFVRESIAKIQGKEIPPNGHRSDWVFMNIIGQRFEHEADILGASLANKAGYYSEFSALEKMDTGLFEYVNVLEDHPFIQQRIRFLLENPYPQYSHAEIVKEKLFLDDLALKCMEGNVPADDFALICAVEAEYIKKAHVGLLYTNFF